MTTPKLSKSMHTVLAHLNQTQAPETCVEIAARAGLSYTYTTTNVRMLLALGLVECEHPGHNARYTVSSAGLAEVQ